MLRPILGAFQLEGEIFSLDIPSHRTAGQLQHSNRLPALRGLNTNHNHDLKNVFKSAATHVSTSPDALGDFYRSLLAKGMKPAMARLTLARKMAAIVLTVWRTLRSRRIETTSRLSV